MSCFLLRCIIGWPPDYFIRVDYQKYTDIRGQKKIVSLQIVEDRLSHVVEGNERVPLKNRLHRNSHRAEVHASAQIKVEEPPRVEFCSHDGQKSGTYSPVII
ncbi:hypothetical protein JXQ31_06700 [candidate division KSB1 bacterium]|nr:hypothetical protein [candidate division KSB1 bacterium]